MTVKELRLALGKMPPSAENVPVLLMGNKQDLLVEHILYSINSPIGPVVRLFSSGEGG